MLVPEMATKRRKIGEAAGVRAALYARVSTARQASEGVSLEAQRKALAAYCELRGLKPVELIADEGASGRSPLSKRKGGKRLLTLVHTGQVDAVVIMKLDRGFRNAVDAQAVAADWERRGVTLHLADHGGTTIDTSTAMGKMFFTMLSGFAEMESNLISERVTEALAFKARSGDMRIGKDAPFGWRYDGNALAEVESEQAVIALVREMRAAGMSYRKACAALTDRGFRNRAGGEFSPMQIGRMLAGSHRQWHAEQAATK